MSSKLPWFRPKQQENLYCGAREDSEASLKNCREDQRSEQANKVKDHNKALDQKVGE